MYAASLAAAKAATAIPGYCTSGHGIITPSQWSYCAKLGYSEPTTAAVHAGNAVPPGAWVALFVILALFALVKMTRSGSRRPATQS
jgi:hypothetical protein